jgi:Viral BACON domain
MKKGKKNYAAALMCWAIPLLVVPILTGLFASPAWADREGSGLAVSPTSLSFSVQQGGTLPSSQTLSVTSRRTSSFTASASGGAWLSVTPTSASTPASIRVSINTSNLAAGTYNASVLLSSRAGTVTVPVRLTVTLPPRLVVSPSSLTFSYQQGGTVPSSQTVSVTSSSSAIDFTDSVASGGSWLSVSPSSGRTPSSLGVSVSPGSLAAGTYSGSVQVSAGTGSVTIPVTLTVTSTSTTRLVVSPTSLAFGYQQGGTVPSSQSISVTSSSSTAISFTDSTSGASWLSVSRTSGSTPSSIVVSVNPGSLAAGTYNASVQVSSSAGSITVPVTLTVTSSSGGGGSGSFALLAWSELGMHCMDGKDYSVFSVLPPYNTIYAKLLAKGGQPLPVTSGVSLTYLAMKDASGSINTTSAGTSTVASKTNFWDYVRLLFGGQPPNDVGLHNYPVQSLTPQQMTYDSSKGLWKAEGIPTAPYDDAGASRAYPMAQIIAKNSSGQTIATATVVLAVSDEMSCKNCHAAGTNSAAMPSGGWITQGTAAQSIKLNILKKHDDDHPISSTVLSALQAKGATYSRYQASLYQTAWAGGAMNNPVLCADCHASNALNAAGLDTGVKDSSGNLIVPPLTASMHKQHSSVTLPGSTTTLDNATDPANSCYQCHPGVITKCQRGTMSNIACYNCHGNLSRVGQSTRTGWLDEPNCQTCHQNGTTYTTAFTSTNIGPTGTQRTSTDTTFATNPNAPATGFSLYRFSQGHGSTECSACHGSQHAEYPTDQPNDQVYSTNLQGYAGRLTECSVCHTSSFATTNNGGPHGMHTVGSAWVSAHPNYASSGRYTACAYCHGSDYRGTTLSQLLTTKTLNGRTFAAGHQMNCYDCHNGPNGD